MASTESPKTNQRIRSDRNLSSSITGRVSSANKKLPNHSKSGVYRVDAPSGSRLTWVHSRRGFRPWTTRSRSTPGTGSSWTIRSRGHAATGMSRKPTRGARRSSGSSSRVRFLGSESDKAHGRWFRIFAEHYDTLAAAVDPRRTTGAAAALHQLFRRCGPGRRIPDVARGTLSLYLRPLARGDSVVGRGLSPQKV